MARIWLMKKVTEECRDSELSLQIFWIGEI